MGKFQSLRDEVVYRATLHDLDDQLGDVQTFGWYGLLLGFYGNDYIVHEDSQGFVDVTCYPAIREDALGQTYRSAEAGNAWCELWDEYEAWWGEDDDGSDDAEGRS
jgi:hypothetical protein